MRGRLLVAASLMALTTTTSAQEPIVSTLPEPSHPSGWTLTPSFGFVGTYDDNISLFGAQTAQEANNDLLSTYEPGASLHYTGKHTGFGVDYGGSLLRFRTYSGLNQWSQRGHIVFKRQESERFTWSADANASTVPSTDLVDLGGIPYRRTGASLAAAQATADYRLNARNSISVSSGFEWVRFDEEILPSGLLQGGEAVHGTGAWRHHLSERLALGANYSIQRALTVGDLPPFYVHSAQGAVEYELSPAWALSGTAGVVLAMANAVSEAHTGPAWRIAAVRQRANVALTTWYQRSYLPSFAFGGLMKDQELGIGFHAPLFHSRYFSTDHSAVYRDDRPLTATPFQLPLKTFRTNSSIGWTPQRWVRVEAFYSRTQASTLQFGGRTYRNRIGFQIVTSRPLRIQ